MIFSQSVISSECLSQARFTFSFGFVSFIFAIVSLVCSFVGLILGYRRSFLVNLVFLSAVERFLSLRTFCFSVFFRLSWLSLNQYLIYSVRWCSKKLAKQISLTTLVSKSPSHSYLSGSAWWPGNEESHGGGTSRWVLPRSPLSSSSSFSLSPLIRSL